MCCFSRSVRAVSATNIFARAAAGERQYLAYGMTLDADEDLAMILPLPVPTGTIEDAVTFLDLSGYDDLFADLERGFPHLETDDRLVARLEESLDEEPLEVVEVGSFEASFVPTIADFDRLDPRFRLPTEVWSKLPEYTTFGFAVFKLKHDGAPLHPMAFTFPRRAPRSLFFPTVHIHDGKVHPQAHFDHALFCQRSPAPQTPLPRDWQTSPEARDFVAIDRTLGLVAPSLPVHRLLLGGPHPNRDTYLED